MKNKLRFTPMDVLTYAVVMIVVIAYAIPAIFS